MIRIFSAALLFVLGSTLALAGDVGAPNTVYRMGASSKIPGFGAVNLAQSAAVTGVLPAANVAVLPAGNLASDSVTTVKILDANVTGAKLATSAADASTLEVASGSMRVKDGGVTQSKLAARSTGTSVAAGGVAVSASCGNYSTSSATYVDVTNLAVTIVTTGRPVVVGVMSDASGTSSSYMNTAGAANIQYYNSTSSTEVGAYASNSNPMTLPPPSFDFPTAGTYTYKVRIKTNAAISFYYSKLYAYEL